MKLYRVEIHTGHRVGPAVFEYMEFVRKEINEILDAYGGNYQSMNPQTRVIDVMATDKSIDMILNLQDVKSASANIPGLVQARKVG